MQKNNQEAARRAFVTAASILENAHEIAMAGQSARLDAKMCRRYARKLLKLSQKLQRTAEAIESLAQ